MCKSLLLRSKYGKPCIARLSSFLVEIPGQNRDRTNLGQMNESGLNKKMPNFRSLLTFKPARLSTGKEWFVYYYVTNPVTDQLVRKKIKINSIKGAAARKKYANHLINELNQRLYSGWNPFLEETAPRGLKDIHEVLEIFLRAKKRELRADSMRSYKSFISSFSSWLKSTGNDKMYVAKFNRLNAIEYMDYLYQEKEVSNSTWNNYLVFHRLLFTWMVDNQYCVENHFHDLKKKTIGDKKRIVIPEKTRYQIKDHLEAHDYDFLMVCLFVFHALIRPKEIANLKRSSFDLKNQTIFISGSYSKNKKDRVITIPNALMPYLKEWNFNNAALDQYIFGTNFKPGKTPVCSRRFSKKWEKLRTEIGMPTKMKLYSLRDSGIIQMLNDGISPEEVMKQADHSSLAITTVYAKHANPTGSEQIKNRGTSF